MLNGPLELLSPKAVALKLGQIMPDGKWSENKVWRLARMHQFPQPIMYSKRRGAWRPNQIDEYIEKLKSASGPIFYFPEVAQAPSTRSAPPAAANPPRQAQHRTYVPVKLPPSEPLTFANDIPPPEAKTWGPHNKPKKYNFEEMEVGSCAVIPFEEGEKSYRLKYQAAYAHGKKAGKGFRVGKIESGEHAGKAWGIWRIK